MSVLHVIRLAFVSFSLAAAQALYVDAAGGVVFRHVNLPLAAVIVIVLTRPPLAPAAGLIFGLAVDLFQTRLFGIHGLAYCLLGSVAAAVPVGALRTRMEAIVCLTAAQSIAATTVVTGGAWISSGVFPQDTFGRFVQTIGWCLVLVIPATGVAGGRIGLATTEPPARTSVPTTAEWV